MENIPIPPEAQIPDAALLIPTQGMAAEDLGQISMPAGGKKFEMPAYWDLLNELDRDHYTRIRMAFASPVCKHRRNHSTKINGEIINTVKSFVVRNDDDDWKRALVCGICWMPDMIAVNTRQLRILLSKCKSSINALFLNLGYTTMQTNNDYATSLVRVFPNLKDNFAELRRWTPRIPITGQSIGVPVPLPVSLPDDMDGVQPDEQQLPVVTEEPLPPITDLKKDEAQ